MKLFWAVVITAAFILWLCLFWAASLPVCVFVTVYGIPMFYIALNAPGTGI